MARAYAQWQYRMTQKFTLNAGVNTTYLFLNQNIAVEPRIGGRLQAHQKLGLTFAYGLHSQTQPMELYFYQNRDGIQNNRNLEFSRSQHFIAGVDWRFAAQWRLKLEGYYQYLDKIPVNGLVSTPFSMINYGVGFEGLPRINVMVNRGTAENRGIELTFEKFLSKGTYLLMTGSFFDSYYKGSDGISRSSAFNIGYVANLLAGGEINLDKNKKFTLFGDIKTTIVGGARYTPVNFEASQKVGSTIYVDSLTNSQQHKPYFRFDIKTGIRWNTKRIWQEFAFNIQNVFNIQNILTSQYDLRSNQMINRYQIGLFPIVQYKINF